MYDGYRLIHNGHALKALLKNPVMPSPALAVAGDDMMDDVGLTIFRDQHLKMPNAITDKIINIPYEKAVPKGSGDTLSMDDFETDAFGLGDPYDSIV